MVVEQNCRRIFGPGARMAPHSAVNQQHRRGLLLTDVSHQSTTGAAGSVARRNTQAKQGMPSRKATISSSAGFRVAPHSAVSMPAADKLASSSGTACTVRFERHVFRA